MGQVLRESFFDSRICAVIMSSLRDVGRMRDEGAFKQTSPTGPTGTSNNRDAQCDA